MFPPTSFVSRYAITLLLFLIPVASGAQDRKRSRIHLVVDKSDYKLYVYDDNKLIRSLSIAIGKGIGDKRIAGDNCTPEGDFSISKIHNSRTWVHDFKDGKGKIAGAYGPWFLRLSTEANETASGKKWKGIGIHGTHDTLSLGRAVTEGCIRLCNVEIEKLKRMIAIGTPVLIRE